MAAGTAGFFICVESSSGVDPFGQFFMTNEALFIDGFCFGRMALGAVVQARGLAVDSAELARGDQEFRFLA